MAGFQPVPGHVGFLAKGVFGQADRVLDVSIARLEPGGGGPEPPHRHPERDHLFIVTEKLFSIYPTTQECDIIVGQKGVETDEKKLSK